jgi:hypothetical protein
MTKLVIDGVDQGTLDEGCRAPLGLPVAFSNLTGVPQTVTFTAPL